jgi:hypothetical protein
MRKGAVSSADMLDRTRASSLARYCEIVQGIEELNNILWIPRFDMQNTIELLAGTDPPELSQLYINHLMAKTQF